MHKLLLFTITFFLLTFCSMPTKADTVSLSGGISFTGNLHFGTSFSGMNSDGTTFHAEGFGNAVVGISVPRPLDAAGGTIINLSGSAFLSGTDFSSSSVVINGISYNLNSVHFTAASTTVMVPFSTANMLSLSAPCTVTGGVTGRTGFSVVASANFNGLCGVTLNLTKTGTDAQGNGLYSFQSIGYGFSTAPTPEPTALLLLGTGLAVMASKVRKRKNR